MHITNLITSYIICIAHALKCYQCMTSDPEGCTDQEVECPSENHQCASSFIFISGGSPSETIQMKGCFLPEECNEYSAIYGEEKRLRISKCCKSDLCNTEPVPEPSEPVPNGLQCFGCVGDDCNRTVNCEGIEDHCFTETVSFSIITRTRKGCASKSVCSAGESNSGEESFGIKRSCCQGNFCNAAPSNLLLLSLSFLFQLVHQVRKFR
uniref:UPAR/Ly6 domain-containing protein n=1 Tax=Oryzias melastigma TaxID=30732 RepID=A0A3B3DKC8_ORYME